MAEWGSLLYWPGHLEGVPTTGNAEQTVVTSSASANTRAASYTQLSSSTAVYSQGLLLGCAPGTSNVHYAVEIGVGAAGSEVNVIQDFCGAGNSRQTQWMYMPVIIPAGSRLAGRVTASSGSTSVVVYTHLVDAGVMGLPAPGRMYALGVTPTSGVYGTDVTTSVTSHNATWTQVVASCPADIRALTFQMHTTNTAPASQGLQLQVAVGAAASEVVIVDSVNFTGGGGGDQVGNGPTGWFPCQVPAGTRVAARVEGSSTADVVTVAFHGLG